MPLGSFYSSQGRKTSFPDRNDDLIERLQDSVKGLATFEVLVSQLSLTSPNLATR